MKKTILASAIAAATFSGAALAQESNLPTIYGNIQLAVTHDNVDGGGSEVEHFDNGSTIGVLHDHQIAPGVEGFFKAEFHFNADDNNDAGSGIYEIDEAYVGVRGDNFGQIWVGKDDSTYETAVDEINQFFEVATLSLSPGYQTGESDLIQYRSPSFGGLTLGAAVQFKGDGETSVRQVADPVTGELSDVETSGEKAYPWQLSAVYAVDALELAFAVDSNDGAGSSNENTYGLRASYNLDNLRLTGEFHTTKDAQDKFGVMGVYTLGKNQFALAYELVQYDDKYAGDGAARLADKDVDTVTLQALHNLSDNMYVYFEGYLGGGDDGVYGPTDKSERSVAAIGATYYF